jgi:tetratricopeptide (TPR) repeat protein
MPIVFILILCTIVFLHLSISKSNRKMQQEKESFWNKENQANSIRRTDITGLDYIKIPIENLPFIETTNDELLNMQNLIKTLSQKSILNLTGLSNTDLKLKYGTANITFLSECDNNFTLLIQTLVKWGSYLYENGKTSEAIRVLEYGIACNTDISKNYILLANIYKERNTPEKIHHLYQVAESLNSLTKETIIKALNELT